ncbi:MAG: aminodeoxychorismate synthase component I [Burkholderiaceae bacterium]|jgi:para-aminobenzoate synthetase component 1|nr:aminodeoxychorismate synthase component I [Burkholderiaceae bacterium]
MTHCRFEDRLVGEARVLTGLLSRIEARTQQELPQAFASIAQAQEAGRWIALLLDYELGEWFEPRLAHHAAVAHPNRTHSSTPRLTALVFDEMKIETPWSNTQGDNNQALLAGIASVVPLITKEAYVKRIEQIRQWIAQGEVYQINATFPMSVRMQGEPSSLYKRIANKHPVGHAAFIEDGDRTVLSFSPELFLSRTDDCLTTRPMKGTAPRSADAAEDHAFRQGLVASAKNRAENLMIVDLLRNDLGRIAIPGSVTANPLFSLEKYPSVWTMTSTVQARIAPTTTLETILKALFPCGSVTGAPKIAAMQRIQETEDTPRGLYCGSVGWLAPNGDFSLNVAIRTLVLNHKNGNGLYHVGGGIVHDSDPSQEWEECHWKARILA